MFDQPNFTYLRTLAIAFILWTDFFFTRLTLLLWVSALLSYSTGSHSTGPQPRIRARHLAFCRENFL